MSRWTGYFPLLRSQARGLRFGWDRGCGLKGHKGLNGKRDDAWRGRLRELMKARNIGMKPLSLKAGRSETYVRDILQRGFLPTVDGLASVAEALGVSVASILGESSLADPVMVAIIGSTSVGDTWTEDIGAGSIPLGVPPDRAGDMVAVRIEGKSMAPVYRDGDTIMGARVSGNALSECLGVDCIVETIDGDRFIRTVTAGARGRFRLRSLDPSEPDIEDVRIRWAAPIEWIRRG